MQKTDKILRCPFCKGKGEIVKDFDIDMADLFPSGNAVKCVSGCWIDGVLIDYDAWQNRRIK